MTKQKLTAFLLAVSVAVSGGGVVAAHGGMVPSDTVQENASPADTVQENAAQEDSSKGPDTAAAGKTVTEDTGADKTDTGKTGADAAAAAKTGAEETEDAGADAAKTGADAAAAAGHADDETNGKTGGGTEGQVAGSVSLANLSDIEKQAFAHLEEELAADAAALLRDGEDVRDIYSEYDWKSNDKSICYVFNKLFAT